MTKVLLVGASLMAQDYAKVLTTLEIPFDVICRSEKTAQNFQEKTGIDCSYGGVQSHELVGYSHAIVAVGVEQLASVSKLLLKKGIKQILVEKPGGLTIREIEHVARVSEEQSASIYVGYNRRFYASVLKAKEIIKEDGGVLSGNFEFTEWSHKIEPIEKAPGVKENWFLANSTHVVDMAFDLLGTPTEIKSFTSKDLSWHKPAIFSGAGITSKGALFNYHANWVSAGRWSVEILTAKRKLIFTPLEELKEQKVGSVQIEQITLNDSLDKEFKPGLYLQVDNFLNNNGREMKTIQDQINDLEYYSLILGK